MGERINSFTQLRTWQGAREFAVKVYRYTDMFPTTERYGLTAQMRRSSVSVAANVAEGFSRNTAKDKINFYSMALGSLTETISHTYISSDLGYLKSELLDEIVADSVEINKMINGLIKSATGRIRNT